jgi:CubicO group peptidase (beta-lactamase class C family)
MDVVTTPQRPARPGPLRSLLYLALPALIGCSVLLGLGPRPAGLGTASGDPALVKDAVAALAHAPNVETVSVARVRGGQMTWAGFGSVQPDSRFELGSVTKTFGGLLLADGVTRGEVRLSDPLELHLPELSGSQAGLTTLEELASHRAGLPNMAPSSAVRMVAEDLAGVALTSYTAPTSEDLVRDASEVTLSGRGSMR